MKNTIVSLLMISILNISNARSDQCTKDEIKLGMPHCISSKDKPIQRLDSDVTLCSKTELAIVSSQIYKKEIKLFSLCSDQARSYVEYRYGSPQKLDFKYRSDEKNSKNIIYRGTYIGANNQTTMFWFYNKDYLYRVEIPFSGISKINVIQKAKKIAELKCSTNAEENSMNIKHPFIKDRTSEDMFTVWNIEN